MNFQRNWLCSHRGYIQSIFDIFLWILLSLVHSQQNLRKKSYRERNISSTIREYIIVVWPENPPIYVVSGLVFITNCRCLNAFWHNPMLWFEVDLWVASWQFHRFAFLQLQLFRILRSDECFVGILTQVAQFRDCCKSSGLWLTRGKANRSFWFCSRTRIRFLADCMTKIKKPRQKRPTWQFPS